MFTKYLIQDKKTIVFRSNLEDNLNPTTKNRPVDNKKALTGFVCSGYPFHIQSF